MVVAAERPGFETGSDLDPSSLDAITHTDLTFMEHWDTLERILDQDCLAVPNDNAKPVTGEINKLKLELELAGNQYWSAVHNAVSELKDDRADGPKQLQDEIGVVQKATEIYQVRDNVLDRITLLQFWVLMQQVNKACKPRQVEGADDSFLKQVRSELSEMKDELVLDDPDKYERFVSEAIDHFLAATLTVCRALAYADKITELQRQFDQLLKTETVDTTKRRNLNSRQFA